MNEKIKAFGKTFIKGVIFCQYVTVLAEIYTKNLDYLDLK